MSARVVCRAVHFYGADPFFAGCVIAEEGGDIAFGLNLVGSDRAQYESGFRAVQREPDDGIHPPSAAEVRRLLTEAADGVLT
jgi:hypothetical protein